MVQTLIVMEGRTSPQHGLSKGTRKYKRKEADTHISYTQLDGVWDKTNIDVLWSRIDKCLVRFQQTTNSLIRRQVCV